MSDEQTMIDELTQRIERHIVDARKNPDPFSAYAETLTCIKCIDNVPKWCDEDAVVDSDGMGLNSVFKPYWTLTNASAVKVDYSAYQSSRYKRDDGLNLDLFDLVKHYEEREWIVAMLRWWQLMLP